MSTTTHRTLPDPFIWHHDPMISTWTYYDYRGYISHRAGSFAWDRAYTEAMSKEDIDSEIGSSMRRWSGVVPDDGTVDLILAPLPGMTWRMLVEGLRGAELVLFSRVEFRFQLRAEGVEGILGHGETTRRKSAVALRKSKGKRERLTLPAASLARVSGIQNL